MTKESLPRTEETAEKIIDGLSDPWGSPIAGDIIEGTRLRIKQALDIERLRADEYEMVLKNAGIHANHQDCSNGFCSPCDYLKMVEEVLAKHRKDSR